MAVNEKLSKLVKEIVEQELGEMARISTNLKIDDPKKAEAAKKVYAGTWIEALVKAIEEAGEAGISQPALAKLLGKSGMQAINPTVREFIANNVIKLGDLSQAKKEPKPNSGIKGRPKKSEDEKVGAEDVNFKEPSKYDYDGEREDTLSEEIKPINESFDRMKKLAGL